MENGFYYKVTFKKKSGCKMIFLCVQKYGTQNISSKIKMQTKADT
jgi:hypothetical protein